ncbi:hypothetical protein DYB28_006088, partial [Aphanomyces astaci]
MPYIIDYQQNALLATTNEVEMEPPILVHRTSRVSGNRRPSLPSISVTPPQEPTLRQRLSSVVSNKAGNNYETVGKLKIQLDKERRLDTDSSKFRRTCPSNLCILLLLSFRSNLALRTAVGVVLASLVLTKNTDSTALVTATSRTKQWYFFPEWYILGGLSYVATATVFGCGKNIGSTIRELFQQISGRDFFTILPFIMLFTMVALVLPLETNTKKYMLGNNLYFALTLVSPNDFTNPSVLKAPGDDLYRTSNLLRNLMVYMLLGVTGACIAQVMLWLPYPIFAIRKLQEHTTTCADNVQDLLNLIVDSYCFKNKDVEHMNFLKLKLKRKFDLALAKHATMTALLNDVWWEQ